MNERSVKLICTGQGRGGHSEARVDRIVIREGEARSIDGKGSGNQLRRAINERIAGRQIADFTIFCRRCGRAPQVSRDRMTVLVNRWLADEPARHTVVRDISEPTTAKMM